MSVRVIFEVSKFYVIPSRSPSPSLSLPFARELECKVGIPTP